MAGAGICLVTRIYFSPTSSISHLRLCSRSKSANELGSEHYCQLELFMKKDRRNGELGKQGNRGDTNSTVTPLDYSVVYESLRTAAKKKRSRTAPQHQGNPI